MCEIYKLIERSNLLWYVVPNKSLIIFAHKVNHIVQETIAGIGIFLIGRLGIFLIGRLDDDCIGRITINFRGWEVVRFWRGDDAAAITITKYTVA